MKHLNERFGSEWSLDDANPFSPDFNYLVIDNNEKTVGFLSIADIEQNISSFEQSGDEYAGDIKTLKKVLKMRVDDTFDVRDWDYDYTYLRVK